MQNSKLKTNKIKTFVERFLKYLQALFNTGAVLCLVGIFVVVLYQITARYALSKSPVWTEELSRYLFIYCVVLASGAVIAKGRHVRLELYQHRLNDKWKLIYAIVSHILIAVFCAILLQYSWKYMMIGARKTSAAMSLNMNWVFASTFVFFVLVSLTCFLMVIKDFISLLEKRQA